MEMEIKSAKEENLRNSIPFVKQLSLDSNKVKTDYAINGDAPPYAPTTQRLYLWTQVSYITTRITILTMVCLPSKRGIIAFI